MEHRDIKANSRRNVAYLDSQNYIDLAEVFLRPLDTEGVGYYLTEKQAETTITAEAAIDDKIITVASADGFSVGAAVEIVQCNRMYQGIVTAIAGNDISLNAPLDMTVNIGATVYSGAWDMSVDGSATPVVFTAKPPAGVVWQLSLLTVHITDNVEMDNAKFGGISALSEGLLLRVKKSTTKNFAIVYNNAGFEEQGFSKEYSEKAPAGEYGVTFRRATEVGYAVVLNGDDGDFVEIIVQDDLSSLIKVAAAVVGSAVRTGC